MQLFTTLAGLVSLLTFASSARADGELEVRGAYYKERSTRVIQPMVDARLEAGEHGEVTAHALVDTITSASVAAGATGSEFNETRYEFGAGYLHRFSDFAAGAGIRFSQEPDYTSFFAIARGSVELAQKNTILSLAGAFGRDTINNNSAQASMSEPIDGDLMTVLGSVGLSQLLTPTLIAGVTYDITHLDGFQENPYRTVSAGGMLVPERVPDTRLRHAIAASGRLFLPPTSTVLSASYRFYIDDWGVIGHTPDARIIQEVADRVFVHARYRLHVQGDADFFEEIYDTADPNLEPFLTDDPKLDDLITHTIGLKLEVGLSTLGLDGWLGRVRADVLVEYLAQNSRFGDGVNAHVAAVVPIDY